MENLFSAALGLCSPWKVVTVTFDQEAGSIRGLVEIHIDFDRGSRFCDSSGVSCGVHDTVRRTWEHMSFFQHRCLLHARVPRIRTSGDDVHTVEVPWARPGSSFTLLFEAMGMLLIKSEMPVSSVADLLGVYDNRVWRFFNHWVEKAKAKQQLKEVVAIGVDEVARKKGHNYNTVVVDLDKHDVIYVIEGKGKEALKAAADHIQENGGSAEKITNISMDMSPAFISGAKAYFPNAQVTFDKFHIVKVIHAAMDQVRRDEQRKSADFKKTRYLWLKNDDNLKQEDIQKRESLAEQYPEIGKAYRLKTIFREFWEFNDPTKAAKHLNDWCHEAVESGLQPFIEATKTIKAHWEGIINHIRSGLNNGVLEGINSKIQLAKRRARGYSNNGNLINMIYFTCGNLIYDYPLLTT